MMAYGSIPDEAEDVELVKEEGQASSGVVTKSSGVARK